jgi:hypothetical protein
MIGSLLRSGWRRAALVALPGLALSSCGGGLFISIGSGFDVDPPTVSLASPVSSIAAGQPVTLVATAHDDGGIDDVVFYRVDGGTFAALGSDGSQPYEWTAIAPTDGRATLVVFARARDQAGNTTDSNMVSIAITQ